jgi:heme-degrading monooxygenase HmoA
MRARVLIYALVPDTDPDGVEKAYYEISTALAGVPGPLGNELLREVDRDEGAFVVMSEWEDMSAFHRWELSAGHRATTEPLRRYQDSRRGRSFAVYEVRAQY